MSRRQSKCGRPVDDTGLAAGEIVAGLESRYCDLRVISEDPITFKSWLHVLRPTQEMLGNHDLSTACANSESAREGVGHHASARGISVYPGRCQRRKR